MKKIINVSAVVALALVGGCSEAAPVETPASAPAAVAVADPVAPGPRIGDAGSACPMPLSFATAADWKPAPINVEELGEMAALAMVGDFAVLCEIDAKPAGNIGFIRVYLAKGLSGQPRDHLAAYLEAGIRGQEISGETYRDLRLGAQQGAELIWQSYDKGLDHKGKYAAFALNTRDGAVVVQLSPFGADEYDEMLGAFQLAETTLTVVE
ncbi:lipoprotein [Actinoplanes sp. G11-F43]|uniref:lipoprotein n=1 Tax=Actinoplanes sp. G11-F43 TaxID=3424130 RepID=UPI003D34A0F8